MIRGVLTLLGLGLATAAPGAGPAPPGFVGREGTRFVLDGRAFPVAGTHIHYAPWGTRAEVDRALGDAAAMGFNVVRFFVTSFRGSLDGKTVPTIWGWPAAVDSANMRMNGVFTAYWDAKSRSIAFRDGDDGFGRVDYAIARAGELGLKLDIAFADFWQYAGGSQQMRAWRGSLGGLGKTGLGEPPAGGDPADRYTFFFRDEGCRADYKKLVRHVLERVNPRTGIAYKDDPTIFAWDLMNEPATATVELGLAWKREMAAYVKSIDRRHLLCVGSEGFYDGSGGNDPAAELAIPEVDFGTWHTYPAYHKLAPDDVLGLVDRHAADARRAGKPVLLQEFGYGSDRPDQAAVIDRWLDHVAREPDAAGWVHWRLTATMASGLPAADNGEHFDARRDDSPLARTLSQAARTIRARRDGPPAPIRRISSERSAGAATVDAPLRRGEASIAPNPVISATHLRGAPPMKSWRVVPILLAGLAGVASGDDTPSPALLVLHKGENALAIVDPTTGAVVGRVPTGQDPHELVVSDDGTTAFASNYAGPGPRGGNSLSVIDLATRKEIHRVDVAPLSRPHGLWFADGKLYFTAEGSMAIATYDPKADKVDWVLGLGQDRTHMIVVSKDKKAIYTSNVNSNTISIVERSQGGPGGGPGGPPGGGPGGPGGGPPPGGPGGRPPGGGPGGPPGGGPGGGPGWKQTVIAVGRGPEGFDVSPDGKELWTAQMGDGGISVIDLASKKLVATIEAGARSPNRLKFTPDGKLALISELGGGGLVVLDTATRAVTKRIPLGQGAAGILIPPDGLRAYVALTGGNAIAVVDLKSLVEVGRLATGSGPDGMAWLPGK